MIQNQVLVELEKIFNLNKIKNLEDQNLYNYNTNNHRHICEIQQELNKYSNSEINFSFNPHIVPSYRGMMSTIYCDLKKNIFHEDILNELESFYQESPFVKIKKNEDHLDFFSIQKKNNCEIKLCNHHSLDKIIIVSLIDNLLKGAAGQAVQCFNYTYGFNESISLESFK